MSNLDNFYASCPALMSDGRVSANTDYMPKNDSFKQSIGDSANSFEYRDKLQKSGYSALTDNNRYTVCSTVPYGNVVYNKEIKMEVDMGGNLKDAFKPLVGSK